MSDRSPDQSAQLGYAHILIPLIAAYVEISQFRAV
jgi:hypothetical protein